MSELTRAEFVAVVANHYRGRTEPFDLMLRNLSTIPAAIGEFNSVRFPEIADDAEPIEFDTQRDAEMFAVLVNAYRESTDMAHAIYHGSTHQDLAAVIVQIFHDAIADALTELGGDGPPVSLEMDAGDQVDCGGGAIVALTGRKKRAGAR